MVVDATGEGDVLIGFLREPYAGRRVPAVEPVQQKLLDNLKVDFEQSLISIPQDDLLIAELEGVPVRVRRRDTQDE